MLATARHRHPGAQVARRPLAVRARRRRRGPRRGLVDGPPAGAREVPVPASYNDIFPDAEVHDHVGDVVVSRPRSGSRRGGPGERIVLRFGSATHRAVVWVERHAGRRARGRLHAVRGRRHRRRRAGRRASDHRRRQQRAQLAVDPAGLRRGDAGRAPAAPALRLLQLRRAAPDGLAVHHAAGLRERRHRRHRSGRARPAPSATRSRPAAPRASRCASCCETPTGAEVARATGGSGELTVEDVHPWRPGEGYLYELDVELWGDGRRPVDAYPLPVGHPHRGGRRHALPDQRRAVLLPRLRQARGQRGARQGPRRRRSWSTTSR